MANEKFKNGGADLLGDMARIGGNIESGMTNAKMAVGGPGIWCDLARSGGNINALAISGTPVLTGTNSVAYAGFTVTAAGGKTPYVYSLVGTWPTGISVNSGTGAVSGTPTQTGSFANLSVRVTDNLAATAQLANFTLVIS